MELLRAHKGDPSECKVLRVDAHPVYQVVPELIVMLLEVPEQRGHRGPDAR